MDENATKERPLLHNLTAGVIYPDTTDVKEPAYIELVRYERRVGILTVERWYVDTALRLFNEGPTISAQRDRLMKLCEESASVIRDEIRRDRNLTLQGVEQALRAAIANVEKTNG